MNSSFGFLFFAGALDYWGFKSICKVLIDPKVKEFSQEAIRLFLQKRSKVNLSFFNEFF